MSKITIFNMGLVHYLSQMDGTYWMPYFKKP